MKASWTYLHVLTTLNPPVKYHFLKSRDFDQCQLQGTHLDISVHIHVHVYLKLSFTDFLRLKVLISYYILQLYRHFLLFSIS